jgi:hypothetical protein
MYSLRNNDDLAPFKAPLRDENELGAIYRRSGSGPIFGEGFDLHIADNAGTTNNSFTDFGYSYQLPAGYTWDKTNRRSVLPGSRNFSPSQIEGTIFKLKLCSY